MDAFVLVLAQGHNVHIPNLRYNSLDQPGSFV